MKYEYIKLLVLAIPMFISACVTRTDTVVDKSTANRSAVEVSAARKSSVNNSAGLTFIHVNDTYRVADVEDGTRGGLGRVASVIHQAIQEGREVRVLHGGDLLSPSLESQIWFGGQMVDALNFIDDIAPTYFVAGNHEFDIKDDDLAYFMNAVRSSEFDWVGDNYTLETGDMQVDEKLKSTFTFKYLDKTIGVFAVTLHPDDGGTARSYVKYDADYIGTAKRVIQQLEEQGVDMIIGLTHLHMANDEALASLRKDHPTLEFIVGGHEHEVASREQTDEAAAIFKGSSNARVIWRIDVDFAEDGNPSINATSIDMDMKIAKDADYQELSGKWRRDLLKLYPIIDVKVGKANIRLDVTEESSRNQENPWGNFIADQARIAFGDSKKDLSAKKADLAFINSGMIRIDDFIANEITYEDIARTFGYASPLRRVSLTGAEFITLLRVGYRGESQSEGFFPQVSGFRVCIDRRKPDEQRIQSLQVPGPNGWANIERDKTYSLILPDYIFGNKDGYTMPKSAINSASPPGSDLKYQVLDAIIRAQFLDQGVGVEVDPDNPRFVELSADQESCWNNP